jgi:hypothetical protein
MLTETMLDMLALIVDPSQSEDVRLDALADAVSRLPETHPYRSVPVDRLYGQLLPDFACRLYLVNGRGSLRQVSRPPVSLQDVL